MFCVVCNAWTSVCSLQWMCSLHGREPCLMIHDGEYWLTTRLLLLRAVFCRVLYVLYAYDE